MQQKNGRVYLETDNELTLEEVVDLIKKNIDEGLLYVLKWNLEYVLRRNLLIHLDSVKAYNYYKSLKSIK